MPFTPRSKLVVLANKTYHIQQLPMKPNKEWRETLGAPIMQLIDLIEGFKDLEFNPSDLLKLVSVFKNLLLGSMDTMLEALFAYSPALAKDRERIENEAYDDEAIEALGVVVSLAYPLDRVLIGLRGPFATPITTNSSSPNMESGTVLTREGPPRNSKRS